MSVRESVKQTFKQVKSEVKAYFADDEPTQGTEAGWRHLTVLARILSPAADSLGPVKQVIDLFVECISIFDMAANGQSKYAALQVRLENLFEELANHLGSGPPAMTESMESLCRFILKELDSIRVKPNRPDWRRYLAAREEEDEILSHYTKIADSLERLSLNANLYIWKIVAEHATDYRSDHMFSLIDRLRPSLSACYNSTEATSLKRRACTPDTRVSVLGRILGWTDSGGGAVYWLNGMAGTGKTTIAYSVCDSLATERKLAASFFCSRLRADCRNVGLILPSIAYQLARFSRPFLSALSDTLKQDPDVHTRSLRLQFEGLITKPLTNAETTLPAGLAIVIDALDECDDEDSTRQMLDLLLNEARSLPVKFIVSSRPEPQIRDQMTNTRAKSRLVLHELDTGEVQADIETYLRQELKPMDPAPTEAQIAALVDRAGILFIYAATAVQYIGYSSFRRNPAARLQTILDGSQPGRTKHHEEVDELYTLVLRAAIDDPKLDEDEKDDIRQVLYTVICAREPLTVQGLSQLLQMSSSDRVQAAIQPLYSVLRVVEDHGIITTLHASFPDFMFDLKRSKTYWCDSDSQHRKLSERCLQRITRTKRQFNICELESSYLLDETVPDIKKRAVNAISSELLYACRYWPDHVKAANCASHLTNKIQDFLATRLLLWMEVLNITDHMKAGTECVKRIVDWCKTLNGQQELVELAEDAKRFVEAFASNAVSQSTPHIYVSMLAFWPKSAPVSKHYAKYTRGPVEAEGTALDQRQSAHVSTWAYERGIRQMAVSPDGLRIALGIGKVILVVGSTSGRVVQGPLEVHTEDIDSIAFTSGGDRIVSASCLNNLGAPSSATVVGWDTRTGGLVLGPLRLHGHTDWINCVSFSPDCSRIATGSHDKTVRMWDAANGAMLHLFEVENIASIVVFSPDGTQVAAQAGEALHRWDTRTGEPAHSPIILKLSVHFDTFAFSPDQSCLISAVWASGVIHVWNAVTGDKIRSIEGHTARIICMRFSPDGKFLVSGSEDRTVRVWDAQSGNVVLGPLVGHVSTITSLAFSPDSSRIISACYRGLVCTWDTQHHRLASDYTYTSTDRITWAKFSSDGARFVTRSEDESTCIRDAYTGEIVAGPFEIHTSRTSAVDFKHNHVVSCSDDGNICVCDALTGQVALGPLHVVSAYIHAIAYSPDGQLVAIGSGQGVDVCNAQDGSRVLGPLTDLGTHVLSVQLSPDGTRIVAGSSASTSNIVVWDVSNGRNVFGTLDGHRRPVRSVTYSPNGALIASGSHDCTIILWDAYTGEKALGPLIGHFNRVYSVSFSPDSTRLVSSSWDRTIRIWDVKTGEMVFELLHGREEYIRSVEYSPDGTRIMSCSDDRSVQIHGAQSPEEWARSRSEYEVGDWTIDKDGWVVDDQSRLLVWVPGDLRKGLLRSRARVHLGPSGYVRLKFDKSRMGESWAQSYTS